MKQKTLITILMLFMIVLGGILIYGRKKEEKKEFKVSVVATGDNSIAVNTSGAVDQPDTEDTNRSVFAYICGEVQKPGVFEVKEGDRIVTLLELAGGFTENAAVTAVNLAEPVTDGEKIYIPSIEEYEAAIQSGEAADFNPQSEASGGLVNINKADKKTLLTLPGIGDAKASAIIEYRKNKGRFESVEDIMKVSGIGESIFDQIKSLITV